MQYSRRDPHAEETNRPQRRDVLALQLPLRNVPGLLIPRAQVHANGQHHLEQATAHIASSTSLGTSLRSQLVCAPTICGIYRLLAGAEHPARCLPAYLSRSLSAKKRLRPSHRPQFNSCRFLRVSPTGIRECGSRCLYAPVQRPSDRSGAA